MTDCAHVWQPTDVDQDGDPVFRPNRMMYAGEKAHVVCAECNARTWLGREEWDVLEETSVQSDEGEI